MSHYLDFDRSTQCLTTIVIRVRRVSTLAFLLVVLLSACRSSEGPAAPPDVAGPPPDATKTASGLASKVLKPGNGTRHPRPNSTVTVHYSGWTTDGKLFDSSVRRGQPATFSLDDVIRGWTEGVQMMVEGETRRFWIPANLAYGDAPGKPQGMLVFDVELIKIDS